MKVILAGVGITVVVGAALVGWLGRAAVAPCVIMGGAATVIEAVAARWLQRGLRSSTRETLQAFVAGMIVRLLGVGLFAGLVVWDEALFPPLATGLAYVGVVIPLLFLEARFIR